MPLCPVLAHIESIFALHASLLIANSFAERRAARTPVLVLCCVA